MTLVDRATRCILSWRVVQERTGTVVQEMVHEAVQAERYFSDGLEAYRTALYWPAVHYPMDDKSETYSVEGDNADIRHYLARLGRRSRCFSRCQWALASESPRYILSHHGEHATQFIGTRQQ